MSTEKTYLPYVSLYEAEFMQVLLKTNWKKQARSYDFTFIFQVWWLCL